MKQLAILLSLYLISCSFVTEKEQHPGHPIKLANTTWKVNGSCLESEDQLRFSITPYLETKDFSSGWGYSISFTEKTFSTSYSAPCGNDCFTSVSGTYELTDNEILFCVNLFDATESAIQARKILKMGEYGRVEATVQLDANKELWRWFAIFCLFLLMFEWWFYHRRTA